MNLQTDFTTQILDFPDDYEGKVIATLIKANTNQSNRPAILYVHGFMDYFFHPHVADAFNAGGYNFYALDLRKYGRSLLPHQHINYCRDLKEYFPEISTSLRIIKEESQGPIVYLGHSTGCLTGSIYANLGEERNKIDALVLNSPFLDVFAPTSTKNILKVFTAVMPKVKPFAKVEYKDSPYLRRLLDEWDFNTEWRIVGNTPMFFSWAKAAMRGHKFLHHKSDIQAPVLVMHSDKSVLPGKDIPELAVSDGVLNIEHIRKYGPRLGPNVTMLEVKDAIHDIFLSRQDVREKALHETLGWLESQVIIRYGVPS